MCSVLDSAIIILENILLYCAKSEKTGYLEEFEGTCDLGRSEKLHCRLVPELGFMYGRL